MSVVGVVGVVSVVSRQPSTHLLSYLTRMPDRAAYPRSGAHKILTRTHTTVIKCCINYPRPDSRVQRLQTAQREAGPVSCCCDYIKYS